MSNVEKTASKRRYYNAKKTISYNAPITMIITARSRGKTYGFTLEAVRDYIERGGFEFVYVRRYESELKASAPKIFDDLVEHGEFPGWEFRADSSAGYIRKTGTKEWRVICHMIALSKQATYKGVAFPRVRKIIFDEFIRELKTPPGYLRDDVGAFLNLYKTVSRDRDNVRAILLANACDLTAPMLQFAGVKKEPPVGYSWHNHKTILLHYEKDAAFKEEERKTLVGRIVDGTPYAGVMLDNDFANADDRFIATKPPRARCWYGLVYCGQRFGVWLDESEGVYYVCGKVTDGAQVFALSASDNAPNLPMIERASPLAKQIARMYLLGVVRFDSPARRENFLRMLALLGVR